MSTQLLMIIYRKISVQSDERGLNNACFLDYWWNEKTSAVSLHMNYTRDGETFNDTSSGELVSMRTSTPG